MTIPVITVGQTSAEFVGQLERLHGPVTIVRRCSELSELIAASQTGIARAAIVADVASELNSELVERMNLAEVAVVALSAEESERKRLLSIGTRSAAVGVAPEDLAELVVEAVNDLAADRIEGRSTRISNLADPGMSLAPIQYDADDAAEEPERSGQIIGVWGPTGAPGRTTLAVNIAAELAARGERTILLDADTYGASVATALGLLDESAGLAQACRLADQGLLDAAALNRVSNQVAIGGGQLGVLTGITRADRWPELRTAALAEVLDLCSRVADYTVIDCGFALEADEELSFDTQAPRRNGSTLRCLEMASIVYAVGAADAIGVPRMVRALTELELAVPTASPRVVFNKVRASSVGRSPRRQLQEAWDRYGPGTDIQSFLPADPAAADAALMAGSSLLESAPESLLRSAIAKLVDSPTDHRSRTPGGQPRRKVKFSRGGVRLLAGLR
ncbi:AAA family ATPase [Arthrobacter monumenti]